jgi:hypothetical protein
MAGKPLQATGYDVPRRKRLESPMGIAIAKGLYDVALLLLCNGYRLDLDSDQFSTPLDQALQNRAWDLVELLLEWGADPRTVDPENVFHTYRSDLIERFWNAGLDFVKDHAFAWYLSEHSSNRPLYGWAKRHRADPAIARDLNMALLRAVDKKQEKVVHLLLWAGADRRARVPNLEWMHHWDGDDQDECSEDDCHSAIEMAASFDRGAMLPVLKPDPARDDFAPLYASADSVDVLKYLVSIHPPSDWTRAIVHNLLRLDWPFGNHEPKECLDYIASQGGRLGRVSREQCADIRRCLLKINNNDLGRLLQWMGDPECCEPATYIELTRTPSMKKRIRKIEKERGRP